MIHAVKSVMVGVAIVVVSGLVYDNVQAVAMPVSNTPQGADKNSANAKALTAGWQQRATQRQYYEDGLPLVEEWRLLDGKWYYFDESGLYRKGWIEDKGLWYYLDANGEMVTNTTVDGYNINADGVLVK